MSAGTKKYGIVVGVDGSSASHSAVCWAARDAAMRHIHLTLAHVVSPIIAGWSPVPLPAGIAAWQENEARRILDQAVKIAQDTTTNDRAIPIKTEIIYAETIPTLVELSEAAELIAVGRYGHGKIARGLLGSVSSSLVRRAHCPVAILHDEDASTPHLTQAPVLLGTDGSPASKQATAIAFDEASRRSVDLVAVHAWSDTEIFELPGLDWSAVKAEEERSLAEALAGWQERYPDVTVHRLLVCDRPARALVEKSQSAQLVVLGNRGRGGFTGALLGSVSNAVVQAVRVPVIVARPSS
ncbi:universal stress protein [Mycobacterium noviomagense]|uniref:Universal stress protein n=1 Tax=Mycobacterium noviomagense TaxID=459858 RepID=A0A7I7PI67_9MYCO|nr:universal stress protein [Mycobacterium noviomagense]ORB11269.1 universal stress protein UspA [Mycobacterium noviomagense]BBY08261.1 universal stress protein [Mycobacterium noviomagense]